MGEKIKNPLYSGPKQSEPNKLDIKCENVIIELMRFILVTIPLISDKNTI